MYSSQVLDLDLTRHGSIFKDYIRDIQAIRSTLLIYGIVQVKIFVYGRVQLGNFTAHHNEQFVLLCLTVSLSLSVS